MLDRHASVASVVLDHSETAPVFQRHRIDYCCRGTVSLEEAARARGLDVTSLVSELESAIAERRDQGIDPRILTTPQLIVHIVSRHHAYLRKALPFVKPLAAKVARVHGESEPKLRELAVLVDALCAALEPHLDEEEETLFPAMTAGNVSARELAAMHEDHLEVGTLLERIRTAADDFVVPEFACNSYRALFAELSALEADVLQHVHLENHVLMPRFNKGNA